MQPFVQVTNGLPLIVPTTRRPRRSLAKYVPASWLECSVGFSSLQKDCVRFFAWRVVSSFSWVQPLSFSTRCVWTIWIFIFSVCHSVRAVAHPTGRVNYHQWHFCDYQHCPKFLKVYYVLSKLSTIKPCGFSLILSLHRIVVAFIPHCIEILLSVCAGTERNGYNPRSL